MHTIGNRSVAGWSKKIVSNIPIRKCGITMNGFSSKIFAQEILVGFVGGYMVWLHRSRDSQRM